MGDYNKQAPGDNPGYVYMARRGPYVKIGHTFSIGNRLRTINDVVTPKAARVYPVEVIWSLHCADQITTERALHQRFMQYHAGSGEWFLLPDEEVAWVMAQTEEAICVEYNPADFRRTDVW